MTTPTNAAIWIENNVISFFAAKYRQPVTLFNWDSNVRSAFDLKQAARWKSLGSEINRADWLIAIHIIIDVDSTSWTKCSTIGDIATYLYNLYESHKNFVLKVSGKPNLTKLLKSDAKPTRNVRADAS
ncbi:hypothetical protein ABIF07_000221 [Bradyrhizobium elkanii]|uniref:hypothetical protein n=1 Tax=Bradyrhizobium elkanii TaxID=29448 RepID=UPI002166FFA3|nr:hypothetical protein [Bradyrhizobium elkanii]MCS3695023.1 hypothetical protein [Bradyrhizobium elkanii]